MAYATAADMIERFGEREMIQLTDRVNKPASTVDAAVITSAVADASAVADSYLASRLDLPLATVPPALVGIVCDLARYRLTGNAAEKDGPIDRANTAAIGWLKDVARGLVVLAEPSGEPAAAAGDGGVRIAAPSRALTRDSLRGL